MAYSHLYLPQINDLTALELHEKFFQACIETSLLRTHDINQYIASEIAYHIDFFDLLRVYIDESNIRYDVDKIKELSIKSYGFMVDNNIFKINNTDRTILQLFKLQILI